MMHARGKRATVFSAIGHGFWTFVRIYLIRRGFLDGRHGLVLAVTAAAGSFFRYAKLSFLSDSRKSISFPPISLRVTVGHATSLASPARTRWMCLGTHWMGRAPQIGRAACRDTMVGGVCIL